MILNQHPTEPIETSGDLVSQEYVIQSSAKAFAILSDNLYAQKIPAIIRELSCNAVDSHVEAGKADIPFSIHLPTKLEQWFEIRDYGVGMDDVDITTVYTTYFESTKSKRNDLIGALGLGSKSPFSYTSSFTITTTKNGVTRVYSAYLNEQRIPCLALLTTTTDYREQGVAIKFSVVDLTDIPLFTSAAQLVLQHFKTLPVITPVFVLIPAKQYDSNFKDLQQCGVFLYSDSTKPSVAIMGNVAYEIALPESTLKELDPGIQVILRHGVEMHFDLGVLDFQPSREGLSYIKSTTSALINKARMLYEHILSRVHTHLIGVGENPWNKAAAAFSLMSETAVQSHAVTSYVKAKPLPTITETGYGTIQYVTITLNKVAIAAKYNVAVESLIVTPRVNAGHGFNSCTRLASGSEYVTLPGKVLAHRNTKPITYDASTKSCVAKVQNWCRHNWALNRTQATSQVYVFERADVTKPMKLDLFISEVLFNCPTCTLADILATAPPRPVTNTRTGFRVRGLRYDKYARSSNWDSSVTPYTHLDQTTQNVYAPTTGYSLVSRYSGTTDLRELLRLVNTSCIPKLNLSTVYAITDQKTVDMVITQPNWCNLEDIIITQMIAIAPAMIKQAGISAHVNHEDTYKAVVASLELIQHKLHPYSPARIFLEHNPTSTVHLSTYVRLMTIFKSHPKINALSIQWKTVMNKLKQIHDHYPLLFSSQHTTSPTSLVAYCNMVDNAYFASLEGH